MLKPLGSDYVPIWYNERD
ncbi:uncharacterized protein FTOL_13577 [Fusarium torulosum]|uniref:Uncharacterized protein n=1 Tax=Fusarium torulosum TaxID=33205 RepID=A0AAE8SPZ5_9HYPO|nr:uncharacterized protein FTOL_13577 [Fusarium torulosum]